MEKIIIEIFSKYIEVELIYLFGSCITDRFNSESDVDIAYFSKETISKENNIKLIFELVEKLGREIDLIDLNSVGISLKKEVIYKGKNIYKKNACVKENFEFQQVALYGQFCDDIKIIKQTIKERGYVSYAGNNSF